MYRRATSGSLPGRWLVAGLALLGVACTGSIGGACAGPHAR